MALAHAGFPGTLARFGAVTQPLLPERRETGWAPVWLCVSLAHPVLFAGAPGPPGVPIIVRYSSAIAIHWSSGDPGKGPITRYVIEARPSGTPTESASHRPPPSRVPTWHTSVCGHPRWCLRYFREARGGLCVWETGGVHPELRNAPEAPPRMPLSAR